MSVSSATPIEVVIGATRKTLDLTILDQDNNPVDISGGAVRLQGTSADVPAKTIDAVGSIHDGPNGLARWTSVGTLVTTGDLGGLTEATWTMRVKFTDTGSLIDFGPAFQITFAKPPAV